MENLARFRWGWIIFAGWTALAACSEGTQGSVEVGSTQAELRSPLDLPGGPHLHPSPPGKPLEDDAGVSAGSIQATRRIALSGTGTFRADSQYASLPRYEFLPGLLEARDSRRPAEGNHEEGTPSWTVGDKPEASGGKGFGVGAEDWTPPRSTHIDDAHYYAPVVALNPYTPPSEHLTPVAGPAAGQKPLIFHDRGTGWMAPQEDEPDLPGSPSSPASALLPPIPETRVYFSPHTRVTLVPAPRRLDLINGNPNLNRYYFENLP